MESTPKVICGTFCRASRNIQSTASRSFCRGISPQLLLKVHPEPHNSITTSLSRRSLAHPYHLKKATELPVRHQRRFPKALYFQSAGCGKDDRIGETIYLRCSVETDLCSP